MENLIKSIEEKRDALQRKYYSETNSDERAYINGKIWAYDEIKFELLKLIKESR